MKTLSVHDKIDLSSLAHEAMKEPISLNEAGKPIGVVISMEAYMAYQQMISQGKETNSKIEAFRKAVKDSESASSGEVIDEEDYYKQYLEN